MSKDTPIPSPSLEADFSSPEGSGQSYIPGDREGADVSPVPGLERGEWRECAGSLRKR